MAERLRRPLTEAQFLQQVLALARLGGWRWFHAYLSVKSPPGYPDLTLAKAGEPLLVVELKTDTGRLTPAQADWLALLAQVRGVEAAVWRPAALAAIADRLTRPLVEEGTMRTTRRP